MNQDCEEKRKVSKIINAAGESYLGVRGVQGLAARGAAGLPCATDRAAGLIGDFLDAVATRGVLRLRALRQVDRLITGGARG